ncbi:MAG: hypothetical protein ACRC92_26745 [Peptostreptococcaceae bacterium]
MAGIKNKEEAINAGLTEVKTTLETNLKKVGVETPNATSLKTLVAQVGSLVYMPVSDRTDLDDSNSIASSKALHTAVGALTTLIGSHDHTGEYVEVGKLGVASGVATLDANGKILGAQIPKIAVTDVITVETKEAMLALTTEQVQKGDVCVIQTPKRVTMMLTDADPSVEDNWVPIKSDDTVTSVNGQIGDVVIGVATASTDGLMAKADKVKLAGLSNYTLTKATDSALGGVKIGANITVAEDGTISVHAPFVHPEGEHVTTAEKTKWNGAYATGTLEEGETLVDAGKLIAALKAAQAEIVTLKAQLVGVEAKQDENLSIIG